MSVKSQISSDYLSIQMSTHKDKPRVKLTNTVITGDKRHGSIGQHIRLALINQGHLVTSYEGDVRRLQEFPSQKDTLIMCHGVTHLDWFEDIPIPKMIEIFNVNLASTALLIQQFVKGTINSPTRKNIIAIGSMAYKAVLNGSAVYCASKAGLAHLMKCLAWELAPKGYDVFCIHPSNTEGTPMSYETIEGLMRYRGMTRPEAEAYWNDSQIRAKSLQPEEIATLVLRLLTDDLHYLAGAQLELAGGQR